MSNYLNKIASIAWLLIKVVLLVTLIRGVSYLANVSISIPILDNILIGIWSYCGRALGF